MDRVFMLYQETMQIVQYLSQIELYILFHSAFLVKRGGLLMVTLLPCRLLRISNFEQYNPNIADNQFFDHIKSV